MFGNTIRIALVGARWASFLVFQPLSTRALTLIVYAKVFSQIFDSSIADNWKHRHVFEDLLKLADRHGIVDMTIEAIVRRSRLPKLMVEEAIKALCDPDPKSRTRDHEGRRLLPLDSERGWGWKIVNYAKYRSIKNEEGRASYMRDYMRNYMKGKRSMSNKSNNVKHTSNSASAYTSVSDQDQGGAGGKRFKVPEFHELEFHAVKIGLPATEINKFFDFYQSKGWKVGKSPMKCWRSAMQNWKRTYDEGRYSNKAGGRENPRNVGIVRGTTNYAAAAARKLQRDAATTQDVAEQVVKNGDNTSRDSCSTE